MKNLILFNKKSLKIKIFINNFYKYYKIYFFSS